MSDKCLPTKSGFNPKHRYKVVQFTNGLGRTWYNIKIIGYLWNSWYKMYYNTDYGWTGFVPDFDSEQEAIDHLKREKKEYFNLKLQNIITSKQGDVCEI